MRRNKISPFCLSRTLCASKTTFVFVFTKFGNEFNKSGWMRQLECHIADWRTNGQTDRQVHGIYRTSHMRHAVKPVSIRRRSSRRLIRLSKGSCTCEAVRCVAVRHVALSCRNMLHYAASCCVHCHTFTRRKTTQGHARQRAAQRGTACRRARCRAAPCGAGTQRNAMHRIRCERTWSQTT